MGQCADVENWLRWTQSVRGSGSPPRSSTCVTLSACPASQAGCSTTKPGRFYEIVSGVATASNTSPPSFDPMMQAAYWKPLIGVAPPGTRRWLSAYFLDPRQSICGVYCSPGSDREPEEAIPRSASTPLNATHNAIGHSRAPLWAAGRL